MMSFNVFCGNSSFWDNKISWNTTSPELSNCFESTILIWVPCTIFWLLATYEMSVAYRSRKRPNKWTWLHITKQILNMSVFLLSAIKLISSLVIYTNEDKRDIELSNLIGDGIVTLTFIMVLFLTAYSKQKGILVSNALPAFWLLQCISYAAITYSNYRRNLSDTKLERLNNVVDLIAVVIAPIQLIFNSFCETPSSFEILNNEEDIQENCPGKRNSLFAFISFSWATKTIISGTKRELEIAHLDQLCKDMRSAVVTRVYDAAFQASARAIRDRDNLDPEVAIRRPVKLALVRSLWRVSRWTFSLGACFEFVFVMLTFVPPFLLSKLINFVETPSEVTWHGFVYAAAFWFVILSQSITNTLSMYFCMVASIQVKNSLISAVYRKIMLISNKAKKQYTAGEIVNLMAIDTQEIFEFTRYLYEFVGIPVRTSLTLWYLYSYLGPSAFASFGVFVILSPLSYLLGLKVDYYQDKVMKLKDKRLKQMSEILNGIKVLKLYAWERPFINKVLETRNSELGYLQKGAYLESFFAFLWIVAPYLICITCFGTFLLSNSANVLTAEIAFVSFSLISMLRYPMGVLPDLLTRLVKSLVSLRRLKDFLFSEEINSATVGDNTNTGDSINIKNASFAWDESKSVLKNINLNVKKGSLVAIVGPVGSGKTSILSAILGEIPKKSGVINKNGSVAYVPQQAWIQNATLEKNIIFKKAYSQRRYTEVLDNCALRADLELLSGGDQTEIGEKGINLSGGQKQRVSLARAVFQNEDIYLLDDPLSAVDANVAAQLFKGVIGPSGMLKRKTRILATHNIAFLSETDHIVVLADGEIAEQGSYETLMNDGGKFSEFLKEHTNQETKDEGENSIKSFDGSSSVIQRQASVLSHDSSPTDHNPTIVDRLTEEESMELGKVKWEVYYSYIKHLGVVLFIFIFIFNILSATLETGSGLWLSHWATKTDGLSSQTAGLGVYGGFILTLALVIFACYILLFYGAVTAARNLHVELLDCIMRCPLSFFDTTPSGRILNRFSKDIETVDAQLPWSMGNMLNTLCWLPMTCVIISLSSLYLLPFMIVTFVIYMIILRFYLLTSNQLRRFDSVTRSPVYSNFTETIQGTSSIRAYNAQQYFINRSHQKVDDNIKCYYSNQIVSRWLDVVLAILASIIVLATALIAIFNRDTLHVGVLGLALTYCIELSDGMGWLVKVGSQLESQVVGVERIREYSELPPEAEWEISETKPPISWPNQGAVEISNYTASYREGLDPVLVGINLNITPGSKVGIVGRTGAGKSTFILSLFRIIEPTVGYIKIDGLNIHKLGTYDLRSKLTIIPQDPVLFAGTLRLNLDPWNEHSDDEIWTSLERSHLKDFVSGLEDGLEHSVNEGGENLSGGQRQLVCLARALLRKTKILVLDEATASVDLNTDNLIQVTVREDFADCTVITIAHRLNTIINSDKIICFANGKIVEEGKPEELLENVESHFYSMAKDAGLV